MWTNAGAWKGAWQGPSWKTSFWKRSKSGTHSYNFNLIPSSITTTLTTTMTTRLSLARTRRRSLMNSVLRRVRGDWGSLWTGNNISLMRIDSWEVQKSWNTPLEQDWRECRWDCQSGRTCQVDQVHSNQVWPEVSNWVARNHSVELRNKYDSWCPGMWMMMSSANGPVTSLMGKTLSVGRSTGLAKLNLFVIHLFSSQAKCLWVPWWRRCWGGRTWILL